LQKCERGEKIKVIIRERCRMAGRAEEWRGKIVGKGEMQNQR
jgi:hypothetical protein